MNDYTDTQPQPAECATHFCGDEPQPSRGWFLGLLTLAAALVGVLVVLALSPVLPTRG